MTIGFEIVTNFFGVNRVKNNAETNDKNLKKHVLLYRSLFTLIIVLVYMVGRHIPLYGIDIDAYQEVEMNAQNILDQTLSGDFNSYSIFAIGLWPYMLSSMIMMLYSALKRLDEKNQTSPKRISVLTVWLTLIIGMVQAYFKIDGMHFKAGYDPILVKVICFAEMIAGMMLVIYMCSRNQKFGIGNRMSVFIVNIMSGIFAMLSKPEPRELIVPLIIGFVGIVFMLILETTEKRIPVQRVSIHNIYADKNYIAYKLNPAGIMPVMFASAVFMLPKYILETLSEYFPENEWLAIAAKRMVMTDSVGIITYLIIIWILVISFALLMIMPGKMADDLLKAGDSIQDVYAGKQTKHYLIWTVIRFSIYSSIILSVCMGVPLFLQLNGVVNPSIAMLPVSIMMMTGLWITFYREAKVYRNVDKYEPMI